MSIINQLFSEVYYINLEKRVDRRVQIETSLIKNGIEFNRFNAITIDDIKKSGSFNHLDEKYLTKVAVMKSHMSIWEDCYKRGVKSVLILEDDVVFNDDFNSVFKSMLKTLPDNHEIIHFIYNKHSKLFKNNLMGLEYINEDWDKINLGCSGFACVGYFGVDTLNKIISTCNNNLRGEHFDLFLHKHKFYNTINVYTPKKPLLTLRKMGSDNPNH